MGLQDDNDVLVYKRPLSAHDILVDLDKDGIDTIQPMRVLGTHTRAQTQGTYKDNRNNHPVAFQGVYVVHNGSISNDAIIKGTVDSIMKDAIPEVDSVAINIVLAQVKDPRDMEQVKTALERLSGSFAFHAMWKDHPGLSLIVRGEGSPLITAYHDAGCVVFGSVIESVYGIVNAMGFDPQKDDWKFRSMDSRQIMLFENGIPIAWDTIPHQNNWVNKKADYFVRRMLPGEGDRKQQLVYATDSKSDFALKAEGTARDINLAEEEELSLEYTRQEGFAKQDSKALQEKFPRANDIGIFSALSEADSIIKNKETHTYHAFFGEVELIFGLNRQILDVYNHGFVKDVTDRWDVVKKKKGKAENRLGRVLDFSEFYIDKSTSISLPDTNEEFTYLKVTTTQALINYHKNLNAGGEIKRAGDDEPAYWAPVLELDWNALFMHDDVCHHSEEPDFWFLSDNGKCKKHEVLMTDHADPEKCEDALLAASYTLSCVNELDIMKFMLKDMYILYQTNNKSKNKELEPCEVESDHEWWSTAYRRITHKNICFDLVVEETCLNCGDVKIARHFPDWLETMMSADLWEPSNVN